MKLEYMMSIAFYLGSHLEELAPASNRLLFLDSEDFTTLIGSILDDFYNDQEYSFIVEFLESMTQEYVDHKCADLFG